MVWFDESGEKVMPRRDGGCSVGGKCKGGPLQNHWRMFLSRIAEGKSSFSKQAGPQWKGGDHGDSRGGHGIRSGNSREALQFNGHNFIAAPVVISRRSFTASRSQWDYSLRAGY